MQINESQYLQKVHDKVQKVLPCTTDTDIKEDLSNILLDIGIKIIDNKNIEYAGTYVLEKALMLNAEFNGMLEDRTILQKSRVVSVNPGSDNIGREQRYVHFYIVLAEHENMFIGVPITNMAFDNVKNAYVLRNPFEVGLINPNPDMKKKPFNQYWVTKPSVADIRNITGLDKRRILRNNLYNNAKYAPSEYMIAIRDKIKTLFNIV